MNNKFRKDFPLGKDGEFKVMSHMVDQGWELLEWRDDYKYDLKMRHDEKNIVHTFEVKTDFYDSGNLVVEFESRGESSGIAVTEADYWIFYFDITKELWLISTQDLREVCKNARIADGGDDGTSRMYILPKFNVRDKFSIKQF